MNTYQPSLPPSLTLPARGRGFWAHILQAPCMVIGSFLHDMVQLIGSAEFCPLPLAGRVREGGGDTKIATTKPCA